MFLLIVSFLTYCFCEGTYYFASNGTDAQRCGVTEANPCATFQAILSQYPNVSVIVVLGSTYDFKKLYLYYSPSVTFMGDVVLHSYDRAIIEVTSGNLTWNGSKFEIIDDTVNNTLFSAIGIQNQDYYLTFNNCSFYSGASSPVVANSIIGNEYHVQLDYCSFFNFACRVAFVQLDMTPLFVATNCNFYNISQIGNSPIATGACINFTSFWEDIYVLVDNSTFQNVSSQAGPAAIYMDNSFVVSYVNFTNCVCSLCSSTSPVVGGGVLGFGYGYTQIYLANSTFTSCSSSPMMGGAISLVETHSTFVNNTFSNCSSKETGGALYLDGGNYDVEFDSTGCKYDSNQAMNGGSIYVTNYTNVSLTGETYNGCTSTYSGGALMLISVISQIIISGCTIQGNQALGGVGGGGIFLQKCSATVRFTNNSFIGNSAIQNYAEGGFFGGGALNINASVKDLLIADDEYINNTATSVNPGAGVGGVFFFASSHPSQINNITVIGATKIVIIRLWKCDL